MQLAPFSPLSFCRKDKREVVLSKKHFRTRFDLLFQLSKKLTYLKINIFNLILNIIYNYIKATLYLTIILK